VNVGGTCYVNLLGAWGGTTDANSNAPDTIGTLGTNTTTSVSMVQSHSGSAFADCGCNGIHLQIPLGKTFQCSTTTLAFDFATTAVNSDTYNTPAVDIRFCTGPCNTLADGGGPNFYGGPQFVGSPMAPTSNSSCGYEYENDSGTASLNYFPASAAITGDGGTNTVALGSYVAPQGQDNCSGSFDTIDVHLQTYSCQASDTGTDTLSNLRIY
jgi:hypothetical protein